MSVYRFSEAKRLESFWKKVRVLGPDDCWEWQVTLSSKYGRFWTGDIYIGAHVFSYMIHNEDYSSDLEVCHTCDNPRCVNPSHLFLGTAKDNAEDRTRKRRYSDRRGEKCPTHKLKEAEVLEIKKLLKQGLLQKEIAALYGVQNSQISRINTGKRWAHLGN
jgi:predicted XRE-type DNA-binding protein